MKQFVLMVVLITCSGQAIADEGTARHVIVGAASTLACELFLGGMFRLGKEERWKSSIICLGGMIATSTLMEAAQAQERNKPLDVGDIANGAMGGIGATALYLTIPF